MDNTYNIKKLIELFLSKIWIIIAVTLCGGILAFLFSKFVMPLEYSSHISMYVQSYTEIKGDNDQNYNDISKSKQLINTYIEVLKDDAVMESVGNALTEKFDESMISESFALYNGKISPASLRSSLSITTVTDTSALNIVSTTKNAELSAAICNEIAKQADKYITQAIGVGSISTIDTAKVYNTPVAPNITKNTMMGTVAGLILILLIILLIDFFDNTIKDTDLLAQTYGKAIIGEIQQIGTTDKNKSGNEKHIKLTDENVPFHIVESYKSMRTNIAFALSTFDKKIIAISSANPNEGKSTTAANIAIAAAQGGNKVLLVDADMRKSVQHKIFGLKNKNGLSSAISKMSEADDCIQKNVMDNLDVMTAGAIPPNPSELLSSKTAKKMFNDLSKIYSLIIVDLPPVCVVSDTVTLSHDVAGLIMVVRYGRTTFDDIAEANKRIDLAQMNVLGYVLNDVKLKKHGGYYANYKYKSDYSYSQEKLNENAG